MQLSALFACLALATLSLSQPIPRATHSGQGTWYKQKGTRGSCGKVHSDNAHIVAVSSQLHKASGCGGKLHISHAGKSVVATIADTCPGCGKYDLDLSVATFKALGPMSKGVLNIEWYKM